VGQELGAGLVFRIEKLLAFIAKAVCSASSAEEKALVMVKPPSDLGEENI
jgi:hypothetical protein